MSFKAIITGEIKKELENVVDELEPLLISRLEEVVKEFVDHVDSAQFSGSSAEVDLKAGTTRPVGPAPDAESQPVDAAGEAIPTPEPTEPVVDVPDPEPVEATAPDGTEVEVTPEVQP